MKNNKGILVVSFGTSYLDTLEKNIAALEREIAKKYPAYQVYRAFTSQMILNKLKERNQITICNVSQAMEQMLNDGIKEVIVQPTHIISGIENDKMLATVKKYESNFQSVLIGQPLLFSDADYTEAAKIVADAVPLHSREALILMGHGTTHHVDYAYDKLETTFHEMGQTQVHVGTVEGSVTIEDVMEKIKEKNYQTIKLMPFMLVAGDHATNDMAGSDDSWKSILEDAGYEVETRIQGLGELKGIRQLFLKHLQEAE